MTWHDLTAGLGQIGRSGGFMWDGRKERIQDAKLHQIKAILDGAPTWPWEAHKFDGGRGFGDTVWWVHTVAYHGGDISNAHSIVSDEGAALLVERAPETISELLDEVMLLQAEAKLLRARLVASHAECSRDTLNTLKDALDEAARDNDKNGSTVAGDLQALLCELEPWLYQDDDDDWRHGDKM